MANPHSDTDPSTPSARSSRGDAPIQPSKIVTVATSANAAAPTSPDAITKPGTDPGMAPSRSADTEPDPRPPSTDPGVAPPSGLVSGAAAARVVVTRTTSSPPPAAAPAKKSDTIDTLLEGIAAAPQPERVKKQPQSAGEAAAAYQSEHALHARQMTPAPEPSVIVQRPEPPPTLRMDRAMLPAAITSPPSERPVTRGMDTTVLVPRTQGRRVVVALLAAILVVFCIFMGLKAWSVQVKREAIATDPTASDMVRPGVPPATIRPPAATVPAAAIAPGAVTTVTVTPSGTTTSVGAPSSAGAPSATAKKSAPKGDGVKGDPTAAPKASATAPRRDPGDYDPRPF